MLIPAEGYEAVFTEVCNGKEMLHGKELIAWSRTPNGEVAGLYLNDVSGRVVSAESMSNFVGYRETEHEHGALVAASPGWWVVSKAHGKDVAYWERVIVWRYGKASQLWAIPAPDLEGQSFGQLQDESHVFLYDPAHEGCEGPWPPPNFPWPLSVTESA